MIVSLSEMAGIRARLRAYRQPLVMTNGCFDLLNGRHVALLRRAREEAGEHGRVLVALNSDDSVRALKGPERPIVPEGERAELLSALRCVDYVLLFGEKRCTAVIEAVQPDVYVKGGYKPEELDPDERAALEVCGTRIVLVDALPGESTTERLARIRGGGTDEGDSASPNTKPRRRSRSGGR